MDRVAIVNRLLDASQHMAGGSDRILRQRALIDRLQKDGQSTDAAEALLQTFETLQSLHEEHRDHLAMHLKQITRFD